MTQTETLSPCPYVAKRVVDLLSEKSKIQQKEESENFYYLETQKNSREEKFLLRKRAELTNKYFLIKNHTCNNTCIADHTRE
jgi:hypothetical protein